jgi:hypothetical protein
MDMSLSGPQSYSGNKETPSAPAVYLTVIHFNGYHPSFNCWN